MSFYSYIFKPGDFIKGYCFNLSWMDECTHWWSTGKNEAHTARNDHSQSACHFQTCSRIFLLMCNRKQLGDSDAFWHNVCYSCASEETESCPPAFQWQESDCGDFQLGGKKMRCYSQWRHTAEKSWRRDKNVSIHANWCPDPPRGCHRLLSGEGIKGPFTTHEHFHVFHPGPLPFLPTFSPARCN